MSVTLKNLEEYVQYSVRVRAYTVIGHGDYSLPVEQTTLQDGTSYSNVSPWYEFS